MRRTKGSSLLETRRRNRVCIKDTIFRKQPITRTNIAAELELTLPTITTSVNEMMEEGILEELPLPEGRLPNGAGRKPMGIGFRADAAQVIGVELGPYATYVVLMNVKGEILESAREAPGSSVYEEMLTALTEQILQMKAKADREKLLGVGIGLPGYIDHNRERIGDCWVRDWVGHTFGSDVETQIGLPVLVENNVQMRAAGYEMELRGEHPDSFSYFYISRGIACPLLIKDSIWSGYASGAGEIGHTIFQVGISHQKEEQKTLEELAGETVIFEACRKKMEEGEAPILKKLTEESGELQMKQVLMAQAAGEQAIRAILAEKLEYMGIALANIVNVASPGVVVADGYLLKSRENQEHLKEAVCSRFFGIQEEEVHMVFQPFNHYWGAKGSGYYVIRRLLIEK